MAIINCPECNHMLSTEAIGCPQCGCPILKILKILSGKNIVNTGDFCSIFFQGYDCKPYDAIVALKDTFNLDEIAVKIIFNYPGRIANHVPLNKAQELKEKLEKMKIYVSFREDNAEPTETDLELQKYVRVDIVRKIEAQRKYEAELQRKGEEARVLHCPKCDSRNVRGHRPWSAHYECFQCGYTWR